MGKRTCTLVFTAAAVILTGCVTTPPPPPTPPQVVRVCSLPDETPTIDAWVLEKEEVVGLGGVRDMGGRNKDLFYAASRDSEAADALNIKLGEASRHIQVLEGIIDAGRNQPR